jgi:8-oxo-dGTP pyrophosphatase MutT (NUDIX family)
MSHASEKFIRLSQLHRLRRCEQVAAVCYRINARGIEFLLVQTRGGRWTFPKGSTEPGLTHAQAAALEAFEEAGVHGRIEEASFARYTRRERTDTRGSVTGEREVTVNVHLCEVLRLDPPAEFGRDPAWFSAAQAKRRLRRGRKGDYAAEISGVVDHAVARIERKRSHMLREQFEAPKKDALQQVQFEAAGISPQTAFVPRVRRVLRQFQPAANGSGPRVFRGARVLQLSAPKEPEGCVATDSKRRTP